MSYSKSDVNKLYAIVAIIAAVIVLPDWIGTIIIMLLFGAWFVWEFIETSIANEKEMKRRRSK